MAQGRISHMIHDEGGVLRQPGKRLGDPEAAAICAAEPGRDHAQPLELALRHLCLRQRLRGHQGGPAHRLSGATSGESLPPGLDHDRRFLPAVEYPQPHQQAARAFHPLGHLNGPSRI